MAEQRRADIQPDLELTAQHAAELCSAELIGDGTARFDRLSTIDGACPKAMTFVRKPAHLAQFLSSSAPCALVARSAVGETPTAPEGRALLIVDNADLAMVALLEYAHDRLPREQRPAGVHPLAFVDPTATVDPSACIAPFASVGAHAKVGAHTVLCEGARIGAYASIGERTTIHPNAVVGDRCTVGNRTTIFGGAVIGADGFGFLPAPGGAGIVKVPQIGDVVIGDLVEIGANTTIDRGKLGSTTIGMGTKIDNLVQIGHNCTIGRFCILCGMCGISGSVTIGDGARLGGRVGIADQVTIGAGATLAGGSAVMRDVPPGETHSGIPSRPYMDHMREVATLRHLPDLVRLAKKLREHLPEEDQP